MSYLNVKNNAASTLDGAITDVATSLVVAAGEGALFPASNFMLSIEDEILFCSSRTTDTLTVVRAQEGTTGVAHATASVVELRITAKIITELQTATIANTDFIPNNVVVGLLPATSATTLISDISAGVAYINDKRVAKDATSKTYTASKDTYVDLNSAGTYTFVEVANAAAAPAITADSIRLAKVVTDVDNITGVTAMRVSEGTFYGYQAGKYNLGQYNTYIGYQAGSTNNATNKTNAADENTGIGYKTLYANTTGNTNSAVGSQALLNNTTGYSNTAMGNYALRTSNTGYYNTAMGVGALYANTSGNNNSAMGRNALFANSTGNNNIGLGYYAGKYETGSNSFYVNNQDRTDTAGDKSKSLLYGTMAAAAANQRLTVNAILIKSVQAGITAYAGGGQASAVLITANIVEISVCATAADSVKLPVASAGMQIKITNHGAASCDVFPNTGEYINEAAVDTAKALAVNASMLCSAWDGDNWECVSLAR